MFSTQLNKLRYSSLTNRIVFFSLFFLFSSFILFILSISNGPVKISSSDLISIFTLNLIGNPDVEYVNSQVVTNIRLPRITLGLIVGSSLSISGATLQGIFKNPMADPSIIGVSSGAATGAVISIAFGFSSLSIFVLPFFSFIGGVIAAILVFSLSKFASNNSNISFILAGLAIATFLNSIISLIILSSKEFGALTAILNWLAGGLQDSRWEHVLIIAPIFIICFPLLLIYSHKINILSLNDDSATTLGLNVNNSRFTLLIITTLLTSVSVAVCGIIAFVGIMVPHIVRLVTGPDNRIVIPASAFFGAVFILGADLIARTVIVPTELRLGIITSFIGAPFFIYLIIKQRKFMIER